MTSSIYRPLEDRDEIRILELLPHSEGSNAPVNVRFYHVKLSQRPRFEALSYTWGDQDTQHPVTVNEAGDTVAVGSNCISALRALRRADQPRRLWVDALCINQADIEEKGAQIPIIGNVYNSASRTIIFLQYCGSNEAFHGNGAGPEMQRCWEAGILGQETEQPVLDDTARRELFDVGNYPWFERSWIIQETLLSFDKIVICSPFLWSWETFIGLAPSDSNMGVIRISEDYIINKSNTGGWNHVWDGQIGERMPGDMLPMAALEYLVDTRKFKCKLYNDRLYSILSLFNPPLPVPVGYGYSREEVHEHLSGALIEVGDSRFLYSTHRQSWRANWDKAVNDLGGDEIRFIGASRAMMHVRREAQWSRIGYVPSSDGGRGSIRALGFQVGVVTKISRTRLGGKEHELKQRWDTIITELDEPAREKENGSWPAFHLQKRNRDRSTWYRNWIRGGNKDDEAPQGKFYSSSAAFFQDRPLFTCEKEGVIGIGTQDLIVGDEIWYLCGLNVPVCALRRASKSAKGPNKKSYGGVDEVEADMVGLCFLGVNNDMKAMGPTDEVFPDSALKLIWID
ncbi:hypothetical protein GQX73_g1106 [Xylaria multiplex]|uniref:Heterokaryon incompatibility domain-containing protein n=1 Tax=Xylaria multiplex TaxID=323545 RepID=A0A7C8N3M6_9PEZI|nr:hypothetical protein GQX73_g1106 [Xylaria multiplex]